MQPPGQLTVLVRLEDDAFWATVEECPGIFATGDTLGELRESLAEAVGLYFSDDQSGPLQIQLGDLAPDVAPTRVTLAVA